MPKTGFFELSPIQLCEGENVKNVKNRSGAVQNVFSCLFECITTDGEPQIELHNFHYHFKSSVARCERAHFHKAWSGVKWREMVQNIVGCFLDDRYKCEM